LLSKLKVFLAVALAVTIGAGATGLTYQAAAQPPARGKTPDPAQARDGSPRMRLALDELEELRLEVEALRKGLQTTRERVKSLEDEVDTLKRRSTRLSMGGMGGFPGGGGALGMSGGGIGGFAGGGLGGGQLGGGGLGQGQGQGAGFSGGQGFSGGRSASKAPPSGLPGNQHQAAKPKPADDPLANAEKALKELRQHPDNKQATDQLERALQHLKQRTKQKEEPAK